MSGRKKSDPDKDIPDLTGKTILVTGGTVDSDWTVKYQYGRQFTELCC